MLRGAARHSQACPQQCRGSCLSGPQSGQFIIRQPGHAGEFRTSRNVLAIFWRPGEAIGAGKRKSRPLAWRQGGEFPRIQADARGHSPRPALNRNGVNGDRLRHSDGIPKPNTRSRKRTALLPGEGAGAEYVGAMMCRDCPSSTGARCARPGSRSRDKKAPDDAQGLVLSRLDENECADCCCSSSARADKMMPILPG
jgi:hypothetical protein